MSRGPYPIMLLLAMSLPGAARAIGLGDIRVDSALNEPLSAQIDIVGATREELIALTAQVANREVFQRFGAERPAFLATATFKVGLDTSGRPVLNVRSSESFTDPVVNFLVDLRWSKGELIREYSLLLDPAGFGPAGMIPGTRLAQTVPTSTATSSTAESAVAQTGTAPTALAAAAAQPTRSPYHRVVLGETLRGIVRGAGARGETQAQRMMIAIFRSNPHAFDGNINRVHRGALLNLPPPREVDAIGAADARREVSAQMTAWRSDGRAAPMHLTAANPATPTLDHGATAAAVATPARTAPDVAPVAVATAAANDALKGRIQSLEKALDEVHRQIADDNAKIAVLKQRADTAAAPSPAAAVAPEAATPAVVATVAASPPPAALEPAAAHVEINAAPRAPAAPVTAAIVMPPAPTQTMSTAVVGSLAAALALLAGGFAYLRRRLANRDPLSLQASLAEEPEESTKFTFGAPAVDAVAEASKREMQKTAAVSASVRELPTAEPTTPATIVAEEIHLRETPQLDDTLGIDTVALERSYLDALGIDNLGIDTATLRSPVMTHAPDTARTQDTVVHDASDLDTVAVDLSELDTAVIRSELNTMIIEPEDHQRSEIADERTLDYNLLDLNMTGQHVQMASDLQDRALVTERRTTIVEALQAAIGKDPNRRDLRLKLLETYYSTASLNQRAFVEGVKGLAQERESLSSEDWQRVMQMGREIAPKDPMFAEEAGPTDLANCA